MEKEFMPVRRMRFAKKNTHRYQHWTNAGISLAVLLAQRWQMIFARRYFAHRADLMCQRLVQCWSNSLNSISRAFANIISTILFQVLCWANIIWGYKLSLIRKKKKLWLLCVIKSNSSSYFEKKITAMLLRFHKP